MRVALNLEQLLHHPPGGIGSYTAELARLLPVDASGREHVDVASFVARHSESEVEQALMAFGLADTAPVRLPLPRPLLYDTWNVLGLPALGVLSSSLRDVDLIHAPSLAVPPRTHSPLIVTVHDAAPLAYPDTYPWRGRWFHKRGFSAAARRADVIIAPSEAAADEISSRTAIRRERIRIVPHGVNSLAVGDGLVSATRAVLGLGDEPYVLWVGTLEPRKNLSTLVAAFHRVLDSDLPHRLVIVGPRGWRGTAEAIAKPAAALGKRVHFTGPVRADRLMALYHGADLFAFPSIHEGFGLPVLEAMAQSTPVVCSDIAVLREVAGDAARFVPADDSEAWGGVMVELLGDEKARAVLQERGRERAAAFTWERCVDSTRDVYREVLGYVSFVAWVPFVGEDIGTKWIYWPWVTDHLDVIWERLQQHIELTVLSVFFGLLIAFPLAILSARYPRMYGPTLGLTGVLYTIPSLALFALLLPITGLSRETAVIPLTGYTLLIVIRNIVTGLQGVPEDVRDAARGMGYSPLGQLFRVELPIALPAIFAGIRIAVVTIIGLVAVTALIGQGGLGALMIDGFKRDFRTPLTVGIVLSLALAIVADLLLIGILRISSPWRAKRARA